MWISATHRAATILAGQLPRFHRRYAAPEQIRNFSDNLENIEARHAAYALRERLGDAMRPAGAEHLQIGRCYPFQERLDPVRLQLLKSIKCATDPNGIMNPGALF
ncbi:MAG: hypothetical protein HOI95_25060 [Chromatiales bacterium]|jgi:FAD/FMN-containing dehydrogenase|nr:hypothetical protein [Chromatiales bacterium]